MARLEARVDRHSDLLEGEDGLDRVMRDFIADARATAKTAEKAMTKRQALVATLATIAGSAVLSLAIHVVEHVMAK